MRRRLLVYRVHVCIMPYDMSCCTTSSTHSYPPFTYIYITFLFICVLSILSLEAKDYMSENCDL